MGYDEKLDKILKSAAEVFAHKGFDRASIRDVARASGMSLAGLYYYFKSKDELLFLIQKRWLSYLLGLLEERLKGVESPEERLIILIDAHIDFAVKNMREMKVLSHEMETLSGSLREEIFDLRRRYYRLCSGIIEEMARRGKMRELNLKTTVMSLFGMMNWIYNWYDSSLHGDAKDVADCMRTIFLRGIVRGR